MITQRVVIIIGMISFAIALTIWLTMAAVSCENRQAEEAEKKRMAKPCVDYMIGGWGPNSCDSRTRLVVHGDVAYCECTR